MVDAVCLHERYVYLWLRMRKLRLNFVLQLVASGTFDGVNSRAQTAPASIWSGFPLFLYEAAGSHVRAP